MAAFDPHRTGQMSCQASACFSALSLSPCPAFTLLWEHPHIFHALATWCRSLRGQPCPSFVSWGGRPPPRPLSCSACVPLVCLFMGCGRESWLPPQYSLCPFLWCQNTGFSRSMANQSKVYTSHPPLQLGVATEPSSPRRRKGKAFPFLLPLQVQSSWGTLRVEATHWDTGAE